MSDGVESGYEVKNTQLLVEVACSGEYSEFSASHIAITVTNELLQKLEGLHDDAARLTEKYGQRISLDLSFYDFDLLYEDEDEGGYKLSDDRLDVSHLRVGCDGEIDFVACEKYSSAEVAGYFSVAKVGAFRTVLRSNEIKQELTNSMDWDGLTKLKSRSHGASI